MKQTTWFFYSLVLVAVVSLVGCEVPGGELMPGPEFQIRKGCLQTLCGQIAAASARDCGSCRSACYSAGYDCDPSTACDYSCAPNESCTSDECVSEGYEVELPDNPSIAVQNACDGVVDHIDACRFRQVWSHSDCDRIGAVQRPEMAEYYDCLSALSCEQWMDAEALVGCEPEPVRFGERFCEAISSPCGEDACDAETLTSLNLTGAFLRDDVLRGAMHCAGRATCDDALECLDAWNDAVLE